MSMESTYKDKILEEILMDFLRNDTIPTADELLDAYEARVGTRDMTKPFLSDTDHTVGELEDASASAFNAFFEQTKFDLEALYTEVWDRTVDGMESFDRWRLELEGLKKELIDLERRIDGLLLLRQESAGYYAFVEDSFVDFSKINQTDTTAKVDVTTHVVTIKQDAEDKLNLNIEAEPVLADSAMFTLLTRKNVVSSQDAPGADLQQVLNDVATHWQHRVRIMQGNEPVTGELKIKLAEEDAEVSRIVIKLHSSDNSGAIILVGQYSLDNYNWFNLPTDQYTQSVDHAAVFVFEPTQMQWVKFFMTKLGADDVEDSIYIYEFGADSVEFFKASFDISDTEGSLFFSKELSAFDENEDIVKFNKVALESCQQVPDETGIEYWIKAKNATSETEYLKISPFNVENPIASTILDLGQLTTIEATNLVKVNKATGSSGDSYEYFSRYADVTTRLALVGTTVSSAYKINAATVADMLEESISFYRNVGPRYGSADTVRKAPLGWQFDETGLYLMTTVVIEKQDGFTIDLGPAGAEIDGQFKTGTITIPVGIHSFRTHIKNTGAITGGPYSTYEELAAADPVSHPYNHRKLIEGYEYSDDFAGNKFYLGVDMYCEHVGRRISIFDLMNNTSDDDYMRYAMDTLVLGGVPYRVFVVRFDPDNEDHENEMFALSFSTSNSVFDRIILKARLSSDNANKTPVLTAYRIKLGI